MWRSFHIVHVVLIFFDSDLVLWLNIFLNLRQDALY